MMRFCPNCKTERSVEEWFCAGTVARATCNWDLSGLPIRAPGWRPQGVVTAEHANMNRTQKVGRLIVMLERNELDIRRGSAPSASA